MKKIMMVAFAMALTACGGKLTDEQRKKIKEEIETHQIVQLSDSEIVSTALDQGRKIYSLIERVKSDSARVDSIATANHVKISWTVPGKANGTALEEELIDAYVQGIVTGSLQDNIQKIHTSEDPTQYDTLIYSRPVLTPRPDGVDNLDGVWNIYLSKKQVILAVK